MDPITQGGLAQHLLNSLEKSTVLLATLLGFLSGLAPDLDVFIRSEQDPLLALVFHRQFTHSLLFIPIGGLICSTLFYYLITKQKSMTFKDTYIYATIGYATHGCLIRAHLMALNYCGLLVMLELHGILFQLLILHLQFRY